jgi:carboxypeptidase Taq
MSSSAQADPYARAAAKFALSCKLESIEALINWDAQTNMPKGGAWARGEQMAALAEVSTDLTGTPEIGTLLDEAQGYADKLDPSDRANLKEMRRLWAHRAAVPKELVIEKARLTQALQQTWVESKANSDFKSFAPGFKKVMALNKEIAAAKGAALGLSPYDAMMDEMDPGLTMAHVDPIFDDLATSLPDILSAVRERQAAWPAPIPFTGDFSIPKQKALCEKLALVVGHSPDSSRIDIAPHPFSMPHSPGDVRFTTRYNTQDFRYATMATMHEAGHSMYELNLPRTLAFSPVGFARGMSAHESQSLMLEMMAGRSREFIGHFAGLLHDYLGGDAAGWAPVNLLNYMRRVDDDYIRVEADEISYPLHVILRYRLERALLSGDLAVDDIPGAWNDLFGKLFGRVPPDDARGCLQDIHWAAGLFGYFPNYALGESLGAQLYERAIADDPAILPAMARGDFKPYFAWVKPRIHEQASLKPFDEIVVAATGAKLSAAALKRHLKRRYLDEPLA